MPMSVRMQDNHGQDHSFELGRDIAYFWPQLLAEAKLGLQEDHWEPWYAGYLMENRITEEQLMYGMLAYLRFCKNALVFDIKSPYDALEKSGFFNYPLPVQLVVCAKLAQICTGAFWVGIRSATKAGDTPATIEELTKHALALEQKIAERWNGQAAANTTLACSPDCPCCP